VIKLNHTQSFKINNHYYDYYNNGDAECKYNQSQCECLIFTKNT